MASMSQKASPAAGRHTIRNQAPAPAAPPDWRKREAFLARWATAEELEGSQELAASPGPALRRFSKFHGPYRERL